MSISYSTAIDCPVRQRAESFPDTIAIDSADTQLSYRKLDWLINSIAHQLRKKGISEHTRVAILLDSRIEYIVLLFALFRLRAVGVAINTRFPCDVIPTLLKRIECDHILLGDQKPVRIDVRENIQSIRINDLDWDDARIIELASSSMDKDQPVTMIFSSGSTGFPKAILHSLGNHYFSALGSNKNIVLSEGNRWLLSLPLYHVAGIAILFRSFIAGSTVVIPEPGIPIEDCLDSLAISHVSLVSTQLQQILHSGKRYPHLEAVLVGGSSVSVSLRLQAFSSGLPVFFSYGLSEMSSQVTTTSPAPSDKDILSSGSILPYRLLRMNEEGEILVKGNTLFLGYVEGKGVNLSLDDEGWFSTGDLGQIDAEGRLSVFGRKDNMFISGGENIYPEYIEKAILLHPEIENVMVVPVEDEKFGRRPVAFIQTDHIKRIKEELSTFLEDKLARYMHPVAYLDWQCAPQKTGIKDSRKEFTERAYALIARGDSSCA